MPSDPSPPVLDENNAAFLQSGLSISVGSRDAGHIASIARAVACRVSPDRRRVTVFIPERPAEKVLADIRDCGAIAACFSEPKTHRTIQLKGVDAKVAPLEEGDAALVARQAEGLVAEMKRLGYAEALMRAIFSARAEGLAAIVFTPSAGFAQTPGPRAGSKLG
jgi:hypothetical protein